MSINAEYALRNDYTFTAHKSLVMKMLADTGNVAKR